MKIVYSPWQALHHGAAELFGNQLVPCHERPARAEAIRDRIQAVKLGPIVEPADFGRDPLLAVHAPDYVDFLQGAYDAWRAAGGEGDALPCCTPMPDMSRRVPRSISGRIAYYSFDATAPITAGTWDAAYASAQAALTAAEFVSSGEGAAFALCRPPGHHAARAYYGGYCFLNNAAIAAQRLIDRGMKRVAVLDVDYHHGNGTQSIFYDRDDVLFVSLHGDPDEDYPFFLGHAEERGAGRGEGYNLNLPLPKLSGDEPFLKALETACNRVTAYAPDALVVSLGVDGHEADLNQALRLTFDGFWRAGARLGALGLPSVLIQEGGYNLDTIGRCVGSVLAGFEGRRISV